MTRFYACILIFQKISQNSRAIFVCKNNDEYCIICHAEIKNIAFLPLFSYSEEDAVNSAVTKRGRYYRTHRQANSFLSPSADEDVMTAPELYVKSDSAEGHENAMPSDEHFFSL